MGVWGFLLRILEASVSLFSNIPYRGAVTFSMEAVVEAHIQ